MPRFLQITALSAATAAFCPAVIFSTGCSDTDESAPVAADISTVTYETRGQITSLPMAGDPISSLSIHHEAIPDFVDGQGKTVGMDSMTMPFPPAEGLDLSSFSVGDKVQVTFDVTWGGKHNGWVATELTKLPADTELDFSSVPASSGNHADHDHSGHAH